MLEFFKFIFSNFWYFLGFVIILVIVSVIVSDCVSNIFNSFLKIVKFRLKLKIKEEKAKK